MIEASGVKLLFDHCGRPVPERGLDQPGFRALLDLGRRKQAVVKLSGFIKFSADSHPFPDTWPYVEALMNAFGPEFCVSGSDWPFLRARERVDYEPLVQMIGRPVARCRSPASDPMGDSAPVVRACES